MRTQDVSQNLPSQEQLDAAAEVFCQAANNGRLTYSLYSKVRRLLYEYSRSLRWCVTLDSWRLTEDRSHNHHTGSHQDTGPWH